MGTMEKKISWGNNVVANNVERVIIHILLLEYARKFNVENILSS